MTTAAYTWIATAICVTGTVINIWRCNWCFYFWMAGELMWSAFDLHQTLYSRLSLDLLGLALAIAGAVRNPIRKASGECILTDKKKKRSGMAMEKKRKG